MLPVLQVPDKERPKETRDADRHGRGGLQSSMLDNTGPDHKRRSQHLGPEKEKADTYLSYPYKLPRPEMHVRV